MIKVIACLLLYITLQACYYNITTLLIMQYFYQNFSQLIQCDKDNQYQLAAHDGTRHNTMQLTIKEL